MVNKTVLGLDSLSHSFRNLPNRIGKLFNGMIQKSLYIVNCHRNLQYNKIYIIFKPIFLCWGIFIW